MKKVLSFALVLVMMLTTLSGCNVSKQPDSTESDRTETNTEIIGSVTGKNTLYGVGEPLVNRVADLDSGSSKATAYLLEAMNFGAIREWMHITDILDSPTSVDETAVSRYKNALNLYEQLDLEITGMSHKWFVVNEDGSYEATSGRMYRRDISENSLYIQSLKAIQQSWKLMAETFPQVDLWEVGNEWNTATFLDVYPENEVPLTDEERMEIAVDMMYYAYMGIKEGNPDAQVVSFSPAVAMPSFMLEDGVYSPSFTMPGYGIALALDRVYTNIESGDFPAGAEPVTDPDQYFDLVAWHPYMMTHMIPIIVSDDYPATGRFMRLENIDALWLNENDMAYNTMVAHGDGDKKVILSEIGFNDMLLPGLEDIQAEMYRDMFTMIEESMPYVKTVHVFRLFTDAGAGGLQEFQFGMFWMDVGRYNIWLKTSPFSFLEGYSEIPENYTPRKKAYVLQEIFGGTMPLELPQEIRDEL